MDKSIRDERNMVIGWCRDNGNQINAIHIRKGLVGFYNKSTDLTTDSTGKIFAYGDATQTLIYNANK